AHDPTETEPKGGEHLGERSPRRTQHDTKPQMHDAYTTLHGGPCGCFPGLAHFRQEACPWRTCFTEGCLTAVPIVANGRRTEEHLGRFDQLCQGLAEDAGALHAAVANAGFFRGCPAP